MKALKAFSSLLSLTLSLSAGASGQPLRGSARIGGDIVGNGGGIGELYFSLAWKQLPEIILACTESGACELDLCEVRTAPWRARTKALLFGSAAAYPGLEKNLVLSAPGQLIVNQDLIEAYNQDGTPRPYSFGEATAALFPYLAEQIGWPRDERLKRVAHQLQEWAQRQSESLNLQRFQHPEVELKIIHSPAGSEVFLSDGVKVERVTPRLRETLERFYPELKVLQVGNAQWLGFPEAQGEGQALVRIDLRVLVRAKNGREHRRELRLSFRLHLRHGQVDDLVNGLPTQVKLVPASAVFDVDDF